MVITETNSTSTTAEDQKIVVGLVINPIAGVGGRIGLKGSDNATEIWSKLEQGEGKKVANQRAKRFLFSIDELKEDITFLCFSGEMGEHALERVGFNFEVIGKSSGNKTTREDTRKAAKLILEEAGGIITNAEGKSINNCNADFSRQTDIVASKNEAAHSELLKLVS